MTGIVQTLIGGFGAVAAAVTDAYFNLVTLLLPGNGTNGAQNNTFLDSSTNNFTITRNGGNPGMTQGTFSPFSQTGWSTFFPSGTTDAILVNGSTNLNSTGDFTWECWGFYLGPPAALYNGLVTMRTGANAGGAISIDNNDALYYAIAGVGYNHSSAVPRNQWFHVAMVRSGSGTNNVSCYLNGSRIGQFTSTAQLNGNNNMQIGQWEVDGTGSGYNYNGYISNVRYVTGSALYSGTTYTVPTAPLTAVSGTQVLTCQDNRWKDNSSNNYSVTVSAGTPSVQAFSPFAPTAAYSAATNGGSGYFDGTGDYLSAASNTAFAFGTGDFTWEAWLYRGASATQEIYTTIATNGFLLYISSNKAVVRQLDVADRITSSADVALNTWTHIAVARSGTTMSLWLNGSRTDGGTATNSNDFAQNGIRIGISANTAFPFTGYISGMRVVKGTAVYDPTQTSITVPTAPPTAVTNTQFLANFTNAGITDATAKNVLETVGNAQISTTQSKFGGSSMYFDGTGDWAIVPANAMFNLGTSDFTIEGWFYLTTTASAQYFLGTWALSPNRSWFAYFEPTVKLSFTYSTTGSNAVDASFGYTPPTNTWVHLAFVRSGADLKCYANGTQQGSTHNIGTSSIYANTQPLYIGERGSATNAPFNGYIDDLRITRYARYTANFTAPTSAFPTQ